MYFHKPLLELLLKYSIVIKKFKKYLQIKSTRNNLILFVIVENDILVKGSQITFYHPRSCIRFSGNKDEISIPFIAFPNPFDKFAISS